MLVKAGSKMLKPTALAQLLNMNLNYVLIMLTCWDGEGEKARLGAYSGESDLRNTAFV